eukprot:CAMPEP_0176487930 /NCGR_PEP_ID=MMETSP0200_2-20121128/6421_1 /TAXON_ID=947934 /ORGANISM="Chaetoceros sp., Strain GSL56" /LENGTH=126 /DNA_ID=CAMNT_0017884845 /DNA_START=66 /DNA_END=446 /DNA_ORIENTATION=+
MASARCLAPLVRRSVVATRSMQSSLRGGASPPLPPFARSPVPSQKLVENNDAVWDDGVAPELALDFDCQHVSKTEGILSWLGGLGLFVALFQVVKMSDPQSKNPAVNRKMNVVVDSPRTGPPPASE